MTLENMKVIAKENNGTIPAGMAMTMTDLEIRRAIKHGYLKEYPKKVQSPEPKKNPKEEFEGGAKKASAKKTAPKSSKKGGQAEKKEQLSVSAPTGTAPAFSKEQKDTYSRLDGLIYDRMNDMKKSSFDIAFALHIIYENGYFKIDGYKNIYDYARERYGIARGTTNNFINLVERFADLKNQESLELKPEFSDYSSTQLICMLGHTDDELKEKNITPSMSSRDIKKALRDDSNARGETVNSLNGAKSYLIEDDEKESIEQEEFLYNVVLEMTKETFSDSPDFDAPDVAETCVKDFLSADTCIRVMAKLLLLGRRIQIIEVL